ncbi:MAG: ASCH domain-containing protein [Coriobacteriia bacterium]|nr:ASCH domain-containing protein [Coriobacteriia bacterium]
MRVVESVEAMWSALAAARPDLVDEQTAYSVWHFCDNESDADALVELVLAGRKRATAGLLWSYEAEGESLPRVGDLSVVTDWDGRARCVIRTTSVEVVPFHLVTPEFAATEGEGDGSLEYWRKAHRVAFERELAEAGITLGPEAPVVCECFEVVLGDGPATS